MVCIVDGRVHQVGSLCPCVAVARSGLAGQNVPEAGHEVSAYGDEDNELEEPKE